MPGRSTKATRGRQRPSQRGHSLLELGTTAMGEILAFSAPADAVLRRFFRQHPQLGRRDRGYIAETVYAALRRLRYLTRVAGTADPARLFLAATQMLPAAEQRDLRSTLDAATAAWLAQLRFDEEHAQALGIRAELPDWAIERLLETYAEDDVLALGLGMQSAAPLDLRVNTLASTREEALAALARSGYAAQPTPRSPIGIRVIGKPALEHHALYLSGAIEVQDEGSQLLGFLLAPKRRELVVDFCAGAGGKTLLLGALMRSEGRLYAFDVSEPRLRRLRTRLARSGLSNVHPEVLAHERDARLKRLHGKADRVLVDAPCTGFGTLRRNPDLKWRSSAQDLEALRAKQLDILESAARLLKPGGRLVYATCSVFAQENEAVVASFLARHPEFAPADCGAILAAQGIALAAGPYLRLLPHVHGTDGFFAAALERSFPAP